MVYLRCHRRWQCSNGDPAVNLLASGRSCTEEAVMCSLRNRRVCLFKTAAVARSNARIPAFSTSNSTRLLRRLIASEKAAQSARYRAAVAVRCSIALLEASRPVAGRNGRSFCFALGRGHCIPAEGEACGATEAGERGRHQGLDVCKHCACTDNMHVKQVDRWTNQQAAVRVLPAYCAHADVACGEYWRHRMLAVSV